MPLKNTQTLYNVYECQPVSPTKYINNHLIKMKQTAVCVWNTEFGTQ